MRQFRTAALLLIISTISLFSCGDAELPGQALEQSPLGDHPRVVSDEPGMLITTLPIDDIAEHIDEMPDGIHLRPGVQLHQLHHINMDDVEISRHSPIVRVSGESINDFVNVNPGDALFIGEYAMIAEGVSYEHNLITIEVSTFELTRVIWGNFRIDYLVTMAPEDADAAIEPVIDALGNVTRTQANTGQVEAVTLEQKSNWSGPGWSWEMDGEIKLPVSLHGVFEGRVGRFKNTYNCRANADKSWYQRDDTFCVDRLAAWFEVSIEATASVSAIYTYAVGYKRGGPPSGTDKKGRFWEKDLGSIQLGTTGLFLELSAFGQYTVEAKAGGSASLRYTYRYTASAPFGFDYRNYPDAASRNQNGVRLIPNRNKPVQVVDESETVDVTGAVSAEAQVKIEFGLMFGVSLVRTVRIKGPYIAAVIDAKAFYTPFARDNGGDCAKAGVQFRVDAVARLEFEVDILGWEWTTGFTCENCTASLISHDLVGPWATQEAPYCLDRPRYNRLLVEYVPGGPAGYEAPDGYLIDAIMVTRVLRNGSEHSFYANSGGSGAHGPPNANTCPLAGNVHPVETRADFGFQEDIRPGDRINIIQSNLQASAGLCRSGGRARFSLRGTAGASNITFNNGGFYDNAPTLIVPE